MVLLRAEMVVVFGQQGMPIGKKLLMLRTIDVQAPIKTANPRALRTGKISRDSERLPLKKLVSTRIAAPALPEWPANRVVSMAIASLPTRTAARCTLPFSRTSILLRINGSTRLPLADYAARCADSRQGVGNVIVPLIRIHRQVAAV